MRVPSPRSLLVEHPSLPGFPGVDEPTTRTIPVTALSDEKRRRVAVQLVASAALLADFELWPGKRSLLGVTVGETDNGVRAVLGNLPLPLSKVWSGLGGGDLAAVRIRDAVCEAVTAATGIDVTAGGTAGIEPGFYLDGILTRLLAELELPLDPITARSLWMWRWTLPALPEPGETLLLPTTNDELARRIGSALWAAAVRSGREGRLELASPGRELTEVVRKGADGLRVVAGELDVGTLASIVEFGDGCGDSAVAVGRLPEGWSATIGMIFDRRRLPAHLAVVGISPARRSRFVEGLAGRFDPFSRTDRRVLTHSAASLFNRTAPVKARTASELVRVVGLVPEGLPVSAALELAGSGEEELSEAVERGTVLLRNGRVLLRSAVPLSLDPRHAGVAERISEGDPARLLHAGLATGDGGPTLAWARERLDDLDAGAVRRLLNPMKTGALGAGVQEALAEACLHLADINGARRALRGLDEELARPWRAWLDLRDRSPGMEVQLPRHIDLGHAPRACAELGLKHIRRGMEGRPTDLDRPLSLVRDAVERLRGANRRWVEILLAAYTDPQLLDDRQWRRTVTGGHRELVGLVLFARSDRAIRDGKSRLARRLLRRVMAGERAPGRLAMMQVNLGVVEAQEGRHETSEALMAGAYRLFQTAGYRHRSWDALYNLAVGDLDRLRIDRAAARLDALAEDDDGDFVAPERTRLALARGELDVFRRRLAELPEGETGDELSIAQATAFLRGVDALLRGHGERAKRLLAIGGDEGKSWLELTAALSGKGIHREPETDDGWGVARAARIVRRLRSGMEVALGGSALELPDALAVALCSELGIQPGWPPMELRRAAARRLAEGSLTGWASRVRWTRSDVDRLLRAFSGLLRGGTPGTDGAAVSADLLSPLGVDGIIVRSASTHRELLRIGDGEPMATFTRGGIDITATGAEPVAGPAWELLLDILAASEPAAEPEPGGADREVRIDGVSPAAERLRAQIRRAAAPTFTVLVHGETGSGKDVVAREIHRLSDRPGQLVSVNVAAIPANLLEAELFGTIKGAFTGAERSRPGLVAAAEGGTLFLDEVGDLDIALQVKLLRFLESGEVRPVGADRAREVDVRVICATHRNLERRVRKGRFREDLYYRIAVGRVDVPPLRDRVQDVPVLRSIFEREAAERHGLKPAVWTAQAEKALLEHRWPGNVRELKHTVEVAMARCGGRRIRTEHLPRLGSPPMARGTWESALAKFKKEFLSDVLTRHRGNRSAAARELGISRQALLYQIKKLGLQGL